MAAATQRASGMIVTSTAAEIQITLLRPIGGAIQSVLCEWLSGSVQTGVFENTTELTPQIDSNYSALAAAGDKVVHTVENGKFNIRCVGVGTLRISY